MKSLSRITLAIATFTLGISQITNGAIEISERIDLTGDFRFRTEYTDEPGNYRSRQRIRARLGFLADATSEIDVGFQLAIGSNNPTSTNQSLGDSFSTKPVGIDLAYATYSPEYLPGAYARGGKMKHPYYKQTDMIWDGDVNPEGLAAGYSIKSGALELGLTGSGFWVQERPDAFDSWMLGAQASAKINATENLAFRGGVSYYDFTETVGNATFSNPNLSFNNSTDASGNYLYDYNMIEGFVAVESNFNGVPASVYFDYVQNLAISQNNTGWTLGTSFGKRREAWALSGFYSYRELEADAVIGALSSSGFAGGGTNGRGHYMGANLYFTTNAYASLSYSISSKGMGSTEFNSQNVTFDLNVAL